MLSRRLIKDCPSDQCHIRVPVELFPMTERKIEVLVT